MSSDYQAVEVKKSSGPSTHTTVAAGAESASWKKVVSYFSDVKGEFFKISWTPLDELKRSASIVVLSSFCFGFGIFFVDLLIQAALSVVETVIRLIFG